MRVTTSSLRSAGIGLLLATASSAAQISGSIATSGCGSLIGDNLAAGGELYVLKTHNAGLGPDQHMDWLFDLRAKNGAQMPGTDVGGSVWTVTDTFHQHVTPPEELFVLVTYPDGRLAIDSSDTRGQNENMGVVQVQRVGDSLPVGVGSGIGLALPSDASPYDAGITFRATGEPAQFPIGTSSGIEVAFAPIAELNTAEIGGSGCTIGGSVLDEHAGFGLITGYNVYRIEGVPEIRPTPADFVGHWEYYIPFRSFDLSVPDTAGTAGPDVNGDGLPDGDGTPAPSDMEPYDLAGLHNPNGIPYDGDEVLLYQDSPFNPDGSPRISGTPPDRTGRTGYWYAFQPVVFQGTTQLTDFDGYGFSENDLYVGQHAIDADADGIVESLDLDLDGSPEFYSPQVLINQTGLGLTNGGLPLLSSPVFGQANPAVALGRPQVTGRVVGTSAELTLTTGFELPSILGYHVYRFPAGGSAIRVDESLIVARGGEGNVYTVSDRLTNGLRRGDAGVLTYGIEVVLDDGSTGAWFGPFDVDVRGGAGRRQR